MFGIPASQATAFLWSSLALSPPDQWNRLLDRHVGVALQKEATKRLHWQAMQEQATADGITGGPSSQQRPQQFYVADGQLHLGPSSSYQVQLLGVEGMDSFLWAWALTDDMKKADPTLNIPQHIICKDLRQHPDLKLETSDASQDTETDDKQYFPEFSTEEPIPLSLTHSGETFGVVASGVLGDKCRAIYQVPDYNTGLVCYWIVTDKKYPLQVDEDQSACARLSSVLQAMAHPHASHRIGSITAALTGYAEALDMVVVADDDGSKLTATPRDVFWGDSLLAFVDPQADKLLGISAQYDGALHTTWVIYDESGKFEKFEEEPSVDVATGLPLKSSDDDDEMEGSSESRSVNGSSRGF